MKLHLRPVGRVLLGVVLGAALGGVTSASAGGIDTSLPAPRASASTWGTPVTPEALDEVRGGFAGAGLLVAFGIERSVSVNGAVVSQTRFSMATGGGSSVVTVGSGLSLVQNGADNRVAIANPAAAFGAVVQNSLDGQRIQTLTVVDATANSLGLARQGSFQAALRGAVIDSLRR